MLELIGQVPGRPTHRLVALTFLSLFRMLRYAALVEAIVQHPSPDRRQQAGRIYLVLAVLRSDARALFGHLRKRAGALLAESFEQEIFAGPATLLASRYDELFASGHRMVSVKGALDGIAASLRLEMRRVFERELPAPDTGITDDELLRQFRKVAIELRPALEKSVTFLAQAVGSAASSDAIFDREQAKREVSERLRRDVWMFAQIVRAFASKAEHAHGADDRWTAPARYAFVREFLAYFQALGYPLLRVTAYPRVDPFVSAMHALEQAEELNPARMGPAIEEARAFHDFSMQLFDDICRRDELASIAFDRRAAANALRLYLGE